MKKKMWRRMWRMMKMRMKMKMMKEASKIRVLQLRQCRAIVLVA